MMVNDELGRMWKKVVLGYFKIHSISMKGLRAYRMGFVVVRRINSRDKSKT
jgi:hypothetical protein